MYDIEAKIQAEINDDQWIEKLVELGVFCLFCGEYFDPLLMEAHHVAGRSSDPFTLPACPTCHRKLSRNQYSWDDRWTVKGKDTRTVLGFVLHGLAEALIKIGKWLLTWAKRLLGGDPAWSI